MRRVVPLLLATFLLAQTGCSHYSENHRHGLLFAGGAMTFMGGIITADGAYCDNSGNGGDCDSGDDKRNLVSGLIMMGVGAGIFGAAWFIHPKPAPAP